MIAVAVLNTNWPMDAPLPDRLPFYDKPTEYDDRCLIGYVDRLGVRPKHVCVLCGHCEGDLEVEGRCGHEYALAGRGVLCGVVHIEQPMRVDVALAAELLSGLSSHPD